MSAQKHTPGPWYVTDATWAEDGSVQYKLYGISHANAADARLIAAAPDLLAALKLCRQELRMTPPTAIIVEKALAKAEGMTF